MIEGEQQRALDRANDLCGLNITLEILPLTSNFDVNLFYKDLVVAAMGEDYAEQALGTSAQQIEDLLMRVCRFSHKKRSQGRLLLYLGPKLAIGIGVYSMLRRRPMPKRLWLEKKTNLPVKSSVHNFNAVSV
ncbi:hypothetical protein R5R35_009742 [Gryllus longicercus]|uniref:Ku70/Ku80 N-terminal alpha/beta domain-containing protein n=1 Tax=Gryllus longicercus TaxID=2509291 RepID=A0AAN9VXV9_9ORTH